ncbi:MAG: hypothetical protein HKO90_02360 [Flavobacteriaceae bacterium]|nr:hypothetical protein [Flavobacteriaceae bacterium]
MRWTYPILVLYTLALFYLEYAYGQDYLRYYVTDIDGEVLLYGINTTVSTILLVLTAYNFYLCFDALKSEDSIKSYRVFYLLQTLIFLYLALDERFMLHERIGYVLGIHDSFPLLTIGLAELGVLFYFREVGVKGGKYAGQLFLIGLLFTAMVIIDAFAPSKGLFRLASEDLLKLWAVYFLFRYSLSHYRSRPQPVGE